ncbi:synaptotagmin-like protein 2 [Electrophorus electricus]|uniref:synaptotagmin-like protein 2 n=1 Tax=Electrophorus electricus TaxID=8005 RepID=UPI0015D03A9C|nr:synaptotagmin-like protein 2 [Electrophorus electricus]
MDNEDQGRDLHMQSKKAPETNLPPLRMTTEAGMSPSRKMSEANLQLTESPESSRKKEIINGKTSVHTSGDTFSQHLVRSFVPGDYHQDLEGTEDSGTYVSDQTSKLVCTAFQRSPETVCNLSSNSGMASVSSVSGSVLSVCSTDFTGVEVQGTIQFSISYVERLREFNIFVVQCQNLAIVDPKRRRTDPYVKSYLVPDSANLGKRKTSVKKRTLNPTYKESLMTPNGDQPADNSGEMRLAVRYLPQVSHARMLPNSGEVHIWIKNCKNLPLVKGAPVDPYLKCVILPDTSKKGRQKTRVLKKTANPVFNHTMVYDGFGEEDLKEACVELTVWDQNRLANRLIGGLRLSLGTGSSYGVSVTWMDSTAQEVALWERMMNSPHEWIEDVLPLRRVATAKTKRK